MKGIAIRLDAPHELYSHLDRLVDYTDRAVELVDEFDMPGGNFFFFTHDDPWKNEMAWVIYDPLKMGWGIPEL